MKRLNFLVICESIDVEDSSATKGRLSLIKNLVNVGHQVKVYHYTRKDVYLDEIECVRIREQKTSFVFILSKIQRLLWKLFKWNVNPIFERRLGFSFAYLNDVRSIELSLLKENNFKPDWVLTLSKAASFRVHKALLKIPKWHDKWLAYVHDPFPHHFYPRPYNWVEPGYFQKQEFFREVSRKSAHAIFPSQLLMEWMGSYYPDFIERGIVIPHQIMEGEEIETTFPLYFEDNKFTILHAGSLMKPRNPTGLIEGYKLFLSKNPDASSNSQILLIGKMTYFTKFLEEKLKEIPQLYISSGYVPFKEVQSMQNATSVNVILEAKSEISPFLPGKFPHCVKANKPILLLGPAISESARLLGEDYPYSCEIDDIKSIANKMETMFINWKNKSSQSELNRPDLEHYLSYKNLKEILKKLSKN